ncbi:unnamed protein product [Amoebophrya sp. A120]|nr:unnamed protein product [Amoebophrya sp. A120]|eukprot:GSA120T00012923001.1
MAGPASVLLREQGQHNFSGDNSTGVSVLQTVQQAREQAVLGNYSEALAVYEMLAQTVENFGGRSETWVQCRSQLREEMRLVQNLESVWKTLESEPGGPGATGTGVKTAVTSSGHNFPQGAEQGEINMAQAPAAGEKNSSTSALLSEFLNNSDDAAQQSGGDIWSPPPAKKRGGAAPWASRGPRVATGTAGGAVGGGAAAASGLSSANAMPSMTAGGAPTTAAQPARRGSRNYAKPWTAAQQPELHSATGLGTKRSASTGGSGATGSSGSQLAAQQQNANHNPARQPAGTSHGHAPGAGGPHQQVVSGRVSYLEHVYGDRMDGPDAELIQMLERDCVESDPQVSWDAIAGCETAKDLLDEAVVMPLAMPDYFQGIRRPWRGVLLFGPPGTGKTMLAKAVATECETTFMNVSASTMASKYRGDSEKLVRLLFEMARYYAPTVIFLDEVDALGSKRGEASEHEASRRVKSELLVQMDGINSNPPGSSNSGGGADQQAATASAGSGSGGVSQQQSQTKLVMVLAATNRPWDLDEALRRRLEKRIYIPLPEAAGRRQIFDLMCNDIRVAPDVDFDRLTALTESYSGADITNVCREAAMMQMRQHREALRKARKEKANVAEMARQFDEVPITFDDFLASLKNVSRSVGNDDLQRFQDWMAEFGATI